MCGQLMEELCVLFLQPIEYLLGVDSALEEGGVLGCELPLLLLQMLNQDTEFGNLLLWAGLIPRCDLTIVPNQLVEDRAMVRVDRVAQATRASRANVATVSR